MIAIQISVVAKPTLRLGYSSIPRMKLAVSNAGTVPAIMSNLTAIIVPTATSGWKIHARTLTARSALAVPNIPTILVDQN